MMPQPQLISTHHNQRRYRLNYAPHIGLNSPEEMLFLEHAGIDPADQVKFIAERGFAGIEDNFLKLRPVEVQEKMGRELERHGLQMGCFVNNLIFDRPTFVSDAPEARSGPLDPRLDRDYQTANL
ncbi:hypothetical protein IQ238_22295 [Pleurocapsales cyanobacterium LEGE 06147]|nr:hypothetical protein [Pleurocapsales cyanobacterium LEGE 06147]